MDAGKPEKRTIEQKFAVITLMMGAGFLERNGLIFRATEADAVLQTLALAAGEIDEAAYAGWLAANS